MIEHPRVLRPIRLLVIDDEAEIRNALEAIFKARGHTVYLAETGERGLELAQECQPDVVILDLALPGMSGADVCRELHTWYDGPILVLSVRESQAAKVSLLDLGADDYLTKPFEADELLARVRALVRRGRGIDMTVAEENVEDLRIDFAKREVYVAGNLVNLTKTEFDILAFLVRNKGRVVTTAALLEGVWGADNPGDTRSLRVHISNLRHKIERPNEPPHYVLTEPGVGFRFGGED